MLTLEALALAVRLLCALAVVLVAVDIWLNAARVEVPHEEMTER